MFNCTTDDLTTNLTSYSILTLLTNIPCNILKINFFAPSSIWKAPASNSVPSLQCSSTHSQDRNFTRLKLNQDCRQGVKGFSSETLVKLSLQSWPCMLEHCHDETEFDAKAFQTLDGA